MNTSTKIKSPKALKAPALLLTISALGTAVILPTLIGGDKAPEGKFPATVRIFMDGASCTATLIGPRVLLTAAHCVSNGGFVEFSYKGSNVHSHACEHHGTYRTNETADFALCALPDSLAGPFETINQNHSLMKIGDTITLTGYGCVNPDGSGGNDGILREGKAVIKALPKGRNYDVHVEAAPNAALCFGDSGGPAFWGEGEARRLIGVNSRGDIKRNSFLSAVHMADRGFMKVWAEKRGLAIKGLTERDEAQPEEDDNNNNNSIDWNEILEMLQKIITLIKGYLSSSI